MLTAHHLYKNYGVDPILTDVSFSVSADDRIGLIGPNGCGKTTLLRILAGVEQPDSGSVVKTRPNLRVGYLPQGAEFAPGLTVGSYLRTAQNGSQDLEGEIAHLAMALAKDPSDPGIQAEYDRALQASLAEHESASVLASLGLADQSLDTEAARLSGGQKTRLMLARLLLEEPDLLLLDEPTNHLDIPTLEWLEDWLAHFHGAALIVSHDRAFLDHTVTTILELNPQGATIRLYSGNYSAYVEQVLKERSKRLAAYRDQQYEIRRMKQDIARTKEQARHVEITTTPRQPGVRRIAKKVAAKAKAREHRLDRYLASDDRIERPKPSWQIKLEFEAPTKGSQDVLVAEHLSVGYDASSQLLADVNLRIRAGERIVLTGPNGAGKTSLLRTLAGTLPPLAGRVRLGTSVKVGYMSQEQELIDPGASALEAIQKEGTLGETEARNFLHFFLFEDDDPLRPARELSFGERARLQLALLVARGSTFLMLDEPINHLDIPSRTRFEQALGTFKGAVLAVVHDRYFIESFASALWTIRDGSLQTLYSSTP